MTSRFYLDLINPLRGLGQAELLALQEQGQRGFLARLQWLYYFIEKKDPMVRATKRRLMAALGGLDWTIKTIDTGDDEQKKATADAQAETLRAAYDAVENLRSALNFLCLADLRGYSHLEKIFEDDDPQGAITELRIVEQWFWCKQGYYGDWQYNPDAVETNMGLAIDPVKFVIRKVEDPADEIFAELSVKRKVNDQDWDGFLEDFGVPPTFIVGPPNVPPDKEKEYQRIAEEAVSRRRGYLPNGASIESPHATTSGGTGIFKERLNYIDEQIVIAGTSGKLTVLTQSGAGTLAGGAQKEAFDEIADAIAQDVAVVLQQQFDKPLLELKHPNEPVMAYFAFSSVEAEDTSTILADADAAAQAGFAMDEQELSEKTGYTLRFVGLPGGKVGAATPAETATGRNGETTTPIETATGRNGETEKPAVDGRAIAPVSADPGTRGGSQGTAMPTEASVVADSPARPVADSSSSSAPDPEKLNSLLRSASDQLAQAQEADLVPLRRALETAITDPTPEKLQQLLDELPQLQSQLGSTSAGVLQKALGAALATGVTS